jgi:tRNA 2-thiouridine synthesizing protein A
MAIIKLDTTGYRCPQPILIIAAKATDMKTGDVLEVIGDCPTFEGDIRAWCKRLNTTLVFVNHEGGDRTRCQIRF